MRKVEFEALFDEDILDEFLDLINRFNTKYTDKCHIQMMVDMEHYSEEEIEEMIERMELNILRKIPRI